MRKVLSFFFPVFLLIVFLGFNLWQQQAQENRSEPVREFSRPTSVKPSTRSAQIKDIQVFGEKSGVAYTSDALFRTGDNGETWREIVLPIKLDERISSVYFSDEQNGWAIIVNFAGGALNLLKTTDGGNVWSSRAINIRESDLAEGNLEKIAVGFERENSEIGQLSIQIASSSNFEHIVYYDTKDGGLSWQRFYENVKPLNDEKRFDTLKGYFGYFRNIDKIDLVGELPPESIIKTTNVAHITAENRPHTTWLLTQTGNCEGFKTGCTQTTRIYKSVVKNETEKTRLSAEEITPPQITELSRIEKQNAKLQAESSVFAQSPGGTTRISLNRGFDKCTAATAAQMQTWWNASPFYDVNIYLSGRNRGCSQPQLTAAWVNSVTAQGWGLIPTVVGYQSPCTASTTTAKFSSDPVVAEQQGRGEADIAIGDANNLGLTQGTVLYYDMERYDDLSGTGACSTPTKAFLKGWTDRLKELGYKSGVYGSPFNANGDWINIPQASQPDIVWLARWNNVMSVWGVAPLSDNVWTNHQRIHQWLGPRDETWGGVTFNIDNNISDAPVAGIAIAKNKRADFDDDGKTDISVWRPDTGVWYVWNSSNAGYSILNFGLSTDIPTPGDYDGDGKTDFAVWRPSDGVWHIYSRSIYRSFAFGTTGDIPVPADYDGDGRTDPAVFRPSTGVWYIWNSFDSRGTSYTILQFGLDGDKPVVGDYDGDGRDDIAVWRPSDSVWYLLQSTAGFAAAQFGISTDKPVQADYDGDGRTDLGIYRDGVWYLSQSQAGIRVTQFGLEGDKPAVGDFDGDGKSDITVFRPDNGVWYIWQSQAGILSTQFGVGGDKPVPAAYTP